MFSKNIRTFYLYLVSFVTLMMIVFGGIMVVNSIAGAAFRESGIVYGNTLNRAIREIFNSFAVLVVAVPLYLFHWKKIEGDREVPKFEEVEIEVVEVSTAKEEKK